MLLCGVLTTLWWFFPLFRSCAQRGITLLLPSSLKELTDGFSSCALSYEAKQGLPYCLNVPALLMT